MAVLFLVKCWPQIRPWEREYYAGDLSLSIEPHFYHWLKRGVILLWDPTLGTGSWLLGGGTHPRFPVIANLHLFYPPNLLGLGLAEHNEVITYSTLLGLHLCHYVLAGALGYWYARVLGLDRFPATASAIAFTLSGFMVTHFAHWTFIDTVAWLPGILACLVRLDRTERMGWGLLAGTFLGVALLAGAPQFILYAGLAAGGLAIVLVGRRIATGRPWARLGLVYGLVPIVALGLAAVQLLPTWGAATGSYRAGLGYGWKTVGSLPVSAVFQIGLPDALRPITTWLAGETYFYPGVLVVILAGYALTLRWDWRVGYHATLGLGALLLAFGNHLPMYRLAFDLVPSVSFFRIPARILVLFDLAVAVLAGIGAQALLATRELRGLLRFVGWATALVAGVAPMVYLLRLWSGEGALATAAETLVGEYVVLLLVLALVLAAIAWQRRGDPPALVRAAMLGALVLDLVFGSMPLSGDHEHPDHVAETERALARYLATRPGLFRVSLSERLRPQLIYRHGFSVVDGASTFAPRGFLDLMALADDNPRILDLLNVRYVVHPGTRPVRELPRELVAWPGARRRVTLARPRVVRVIEIDSRLTASDDVADGTMVAVIRAVDSAGRAQPLPVRAGRETAEWTMDRVGRHVAHGKPPIARTWHMEGEGYEAHTYRATFTLPPAFELAELIVEHVASRSRLGIEAIRLDGRAVEPRDPYRLVHPGLYQNDAALPRAYLVRHARRVTPQGLLEELRDFDPAEEVLLTDPVPVGFGAPGAFASALPPVRIVDYQPQRVRLETVVDEPAILVLSDTYHAGWQAWDNGRPTRILRADHALRAVPLAPGSHAVEFRYREPAVWVGLAVSTGTALSLVLVGGMLIGWRPTPSTAATRESRIGNDRVTPG